MAPVNTNTNASGQLLAEICRPPAARRDADAVRSPARRVLRLEHGRDSGWAASLMRGAVALWWPTEPRMDGGQLDHLLVASSPAPPTSPAAYRVSWRLSLLLCRLMYTPLRPYCSAVAFGTALKGIYATVHILHTCSIVWMYRGDGPEDDETP